MRNVWVSAVTAGILAVMPFAAQAKRINLDVNTLNQWTQCGGATCHPLVPVYTASGGKRFVLVPRAPLQVDVPAETVDVPEPGTLALLGLGLIGTFFARRRAV